jgi:hypothetical protein
MDNSVNALKTRLSVLLHRKDTLQEDLLKAIDMYKMFESAEFRTMLDDYQITYAHKQADNITLNNSLKDNSVEILKGIHIFSDFLKVQYKDPQQIQFDIQANEDAIFELQEIIRRR